MKTYRCLVVDDEKLAQELLESYIEKIPNLEWVASCSSALEAMPHLSSNTIDILFLDIQMPDLSGIEFLQALDKQPRTIFTTAYSEYAISGYELGVVDYLLKPIEFERFFKAVTKVIVSFSTQTNEIVQLDNPTQKELATYFFVKSKGKITKVVFANILFVEALEKYVRIHTSDRKVTTLISMSKVLELLPVSQFIRIHRSYIVNIDQIENINGNIVEIKEYRLTVSKGQREPFMEMLKKRGLFGNT